MPRAILPLSFDLEAIGQRSNFLLTLHFYKGHIFRVENVNVNVHWTLVLYGENPAESDQPDQCHDHRHNYCPDS